MRHALIILALLFSSTALAYDYIEPDCTYSSCPKDCPYGFYYSSNGTGLEYCVTYGIVLPAGVQASCSAVGTSPVGWIGYSFPSLGNEGYRCATGFARLNEGNGKETCLAAVWPTHAGVFDYCHYLISGCDPVYGCYMGWGWPE